MILSPAIASALRKCAGPRGAPESFARRRTIEAAERQGLISWGFHPGLVEYRYTLTQLGRDALDKNNEAKP